jgi:hypothetical protein
MKHLVRDGRLDRMRALDPLPTPPNVWNALGPLPSLRQQNGGPARRRLNSEPQAEMQQIALALSGIDEADCLHTDISCTVNVSGHIVDKY